MDSFYQLLKKEKIQALNYIEISNFQISKIYLSESIKDDTMFSACSISKLFTIVLVLMAKDEEIIDLNNDINIYLDDFTLEGPVVRVKDVLLQQSGLIDADNSYDSYNENYGKANVLELLEGKTEYIKERVTVKEAPRTQFIYSDNNALVLELMLENLYNKKFRDLVQEKILNTLSMSNTQYIDYEELCSSNIVRGRDKKGKEIPIHDNIYPYDAVAGVWTTSSDLSKLIIDLLKAYHNRNGKLLINETAREMFETSEIADFFGYGVFTYEVRGKKVFSTQGWGKGFQSYVMVFLDDGDGVIVMMNQNPEVEQLEGPIGKLVKTYIDSKFK